jgi:hypothetical protein
MGQTTRVANAPSFAYVDGAPEGIECNRCLGTYLHGAWEDPAVIEEYLGYRPPDALDQAEVYSQLADWFDRYADRKLWREQFLHESG